MFSATSSKLAVCLVLLAMGSSLALDRASHLRHSESMDAAEEPTAKVPPPPQTTDDHPEACCSVEAVLPLIPLDLTASPGVRKTQNPTCESVCHNGYRTGDNWCATTVKCCKVGAVSDDCEGKPAPKISAEHKDCVMVNVGVNPNGGTFAATVDTENHICPIKVDRDNWNPRIFDSVDAYKRYNDAFSVVQTGTALAVKRIDDGNAGNGWQLDLAFTCCWKDGPAYATWESVKGAGVIPGADQ